MAALESPEAQVKGLVSIFYAVDAVYGKSVNTELRAALPVRLGSLHVCYNDLGNFTRALGAISHPTTANMLVRFRAHFGKFSCACV